VNRPLLETSLRCTMYDAMWQFCTHAMATLASSAEASLHVHVLLFDALSLRPNSVFTLPCAKKHQTAMLVASSAVCGSVLLLCRRLAQRL